MGELGARIDVVDSAAHRTVLAVEEAERPRAVQMMGSHLMVVVEESARETGEGLHRVDIDQEGRNATAEELMTEAEARHMVAGKAESLGVLTPRAEAEMVFEIEEAEEGRIAAGRHMRIAVEVAEGRIDDILQRVEGQTLQSPMVRLGVAVESRSSRMG